MPADVVNFIFLSEVLGSTVVTASDNKTVGRIEDLTATTGQVYPRIAGILLRTGARRRPTYVPWTYVRRGPSAGKIAIEIPPAGINSTTRAAENEILLAKSFLDRQLISTSGSKLVRVNDLHLLIDSSTKGTPNLWLVHCDIGVKGLLRRLGFLPFANAAVRWLLARDMRDRLISWKLVQPTTTTNVYGSLRLTTDSSKLAELHPADLADIIEDLGTDERITLIESLEPSVAASTLQEMPLNVRVQVAETLDTNRLAAIIDVMQTDEGVDLLDEMSAEPRNALYAVLPVEKATELKELSKLSAYSVGSIMNTAFVTAPATLTAAEALALVRNEAEHTELFTYLYIVDGAEKLLGVASLRSVLTAPPETVLADLMRENIVSVTIDERIKNVAQVFLKYNFDAVPVVDDEGKVLGIVTLRDTLENVIPAMRDVANT